MSDEKQQEASEGIVGQSGSTGGLEPLPCPFCGGTDIIVMDGSTFRWVVATCGCGAACGEVRVQTEVQPTLADQHKLRLVLDNIQHSPLQQSSNFRMLGVERGEHQLQLQVIDQNGKLIAESTITTFYLRKTTIASPK